MAQTNIQKPKITKPTKEGYLEKQSSFWKTYRKRWMVLQGYMLYSFKEEKQYENPTEIFDLRIYNKAKKSSDGKTGQFELASPNDSRIFLASSEHEMKDWIKYIKLASNKKKSSSQITKRSSSSMRTTPKPTSSKKKATPSSSKKKSTKQTSVSSKKKNGTHSVSSSKKKGNTKKTTTKKKNIPSLSKSRSSQTPKQSPKRKPKGSAQKVTNNSMNKHIERMQRNSHSKSRSHGNDVLKIDEPPKSSKKKNTTKKTKTVRKDTKKQQRSSVPNLLNPNYQRKIIQSQQQKNNNNSLRPRGPSHTKSISNIPSDRSASPSAHKRSVSSMFGKKTKGFDLQNSQTDHVSLTDDEESMGNNPRDFNIRTMQTSQSERNVFRKQLNRRSMPDKPNTPKLESSYDYNTNSQIFYSVTFESKPFGLTLNPFNESKQIGAVVMVNHNVNDQVISQGSRFISINNDPCKSYKFERIKNMCRNANLPTIIKFHGNGIPNGPEPLNTSISAGGTPILSTNPNQHLTPTALNINMYNSTAPKASSYGTKQNKQNSPRLSPQNSNEYKQIEGRQDVNIEIIKEAPPPKKKKTTKKTTKPKESLKAKQNREKKAAKQLMESLGGMNDIKKAQKYERERKWAECIECYEKGIEDLEKSIKKLEVANILSRFQQKECQSQIDQYCRNLIKLQREHSKDILKAQKQSLLANSSGIHLGDDSRARTQSLKKTKLIHNRATSALPKKQKNKRSAFNLSQKSKLQSYDENVDEEDEGAVFGTKKKRESAVALKKKEMARMEREMKTGKVENPNNSNNDDEQPGKPKDDEDKPEDIYAFLDRSEDAKKHKVKMSKEPTKKKSTKKKKNKDKDDDNKKNKKKKGKKNKKGSKDDSDDDDEKNSDDKKKSKLSKQDEEFRSRLEADIISEAPDVCFKDVQGLANVKLALYETIILPALRPELFTGLRTPTSGLLLFGPPGNGKTMIAKCVAAECASTFFSISASSITSKFVGDAERIMRTLFNLAREKSPSIIFIDEIDSMLTARGGKNEAESSRRIKTEFLIQFDGCKKASDAVKRVLVIGATNLPDQLDEAVLRRFGKRIMVPLPDKDTRRGILRLLMSKQKTKLVDDEYDDIVSKCDGYSCSDLATLCKDAAMGPIRGLGAKILEIKNQADMPPIEKIHFDESVQNVRPSLTDQSLEYFDQWNDKFGSKIHLSMSALPENMRPYTLEQLAEIDRKREEKELAEKAAAEAAEKAEETSDEEDDDSD